MHACWKDTDLLLIHLLFPKEIYFDWKGVEKDRKYWKWKSKENHLFDQYYFFGKWKEMLLMIHWFTDSGAFSFILWFFYVGPRSESESEVKSGISQISELSRSFFLPGIHFICGSGSYEILDSRMLNEIHVSFPFITQCRNEKAFAYWMIDWVMKKEKRFHLHLWGLVLPHISKGKRMKRRQDQASDLTSSSFLGPIVKRNQQQRKQRESKEKQGLKQGPKKRRERDDEWKTCL